MRKMIAVILVVLLVGVTIAGCTSTTTPKKNKPPVAAFSVSKTNPTHNEVITFNAADSYDPDKKDNASLEFEWDFKDGEKVPKGPATSNRVVSHFFKEDGKFQVTLYVYDKKTMNSISKEVSVTNMPPKVATFYPADNSSVLETDTLELGVNATDTPNEDILTYQWSVDNSDVTGETSKNFDYVPTLDDAGAHTISVKISDGHGGIIFQTWNITVLNKNQAPVIISYSPLDADITMAEAATQIFSIMASDPDDDTLTYKWFKDTTQISGQINTSYTYSPNYDASGSYVIKVVVSDGTDSIEQAWNVTVTNANRPPIISNVVPAVINVAMNETDSKQFQVTASDPDGDTLTYEWTLDSNIVQGVTGTSYTYIPTLQEAGAHTVAVTVTDGKGGLDSAQWQVTVGNVNQPPQITSHLPVTNPTVPEMVIQNFSVVASDPDGDSLTYQWLLNGTTVSGVSGVLYAFTPTYDMGGASQKTHTIKVIIKDPSNAEANFTWSVVVTNVNRAPTAKASVNMTKPGIGLEVKFDATGSTDPDGDTLTYTWSFGDQTAPQGGKTVTHTYTKAGPFTATVTVSDGSLNAQAQVQVDVNITQSWMSMNMGWVSPMVIDDVDADGTKEMIFAGLESEVSGTYTGFLYIFDASTYNQEFKSGNIGLVNDIKVDDVNGDGKKEIIVATFSSETSIGGGGDYSGKVYVYNGSGTHVLDWSSADIGQVLCIGIGDMDGDGKKEIVAPHADTFFPSAGDIMYYGNITIFGPSGANYIQEWVTPAFNGFGMAIDMADIDGDAAPEAVIGTVDSLDMATQTFAGRAVIIGRPGGNWGIQNSLSGLGKILDVVVADPDKDMAMEAVVGDTNSKTGTHNTGNVHVLSSTMVEEWVSADVGAVTCVAVDDLDKDNINEIIFGVDYNETEDSVNPAILLPEGYLYILNGQSHAQKYKSPNIGAVTSLALGNIDKNANIEVAVGTWTKKDASDNYEGYIYVFIYNTDATAFQQLWKSPKVGKIGLNAVVMNDCDNDGFTEVVFGTIDSTGVANNGKVYVYSNKNKA